MSDLNAGFKVNNSYKLHPKENISTLLLNLSYFNINSGALYQSSL